MELNYDPEKATGEECWSERETRKAEPNVKTNRNLIKLYCVALGSSHPLLAEQKKLHTA